MSPSIRTQFRHHHKLSDSERTDLWERCVFVFDTNVLLNVYRYANSTRDDLFRVLERLGDRVWVPYQAASEFYRRRIDVIQEQRAKYSELRQELERSLANVRGGGFRKSAFLGIDEIVEVIRPAVDQAVALVEAQRAQHPDLIQDDPYLERLVDLIGERIGGEPPTALFESRCTDAQSRIEQQVPPGYRDSKKPSPERYGDVLIWFEVLDHAKTTNRPIIFVTDDDKEDWWQIVEGKKLGPRPELREEMRKAAEVEFYIYNPAYLFESAGERLNVAVAPSSVADATEVAAEQQHSRLARPQDPSPGSSISVRGTIHVGKHGYRAEDAVYRWLVSTNPGAEVIHVDHRHFDFLVFGASGRIAVQVKAVRQGSARMIWSRLRDWFLRAYYEISNQAIDDFNLYLVVENEKELWEIVEVLRSRIGQPNYSVSIGLIEADGMYAEAWRSPWSSSP